MSELFTQNYIDKPLFHTDTDISESLHNQVVEASNGEELLDNTEKQAESLLSNDDYVSETKNSISDDSDDAAESYHIPPKATGNISPVPTRPGPAAAMPTTNCCAISRQTATAPLHARHHSCSARHHECKRAGQLSRGLCHRCRAGSRCARRGGGTDYAGDVFLGLLRRT